ncbi:MAG TPA: class I adenylate-forming enzyme family protein [Steroidobacteraceae bacterium]
MFEPIVATFTQVARREPEATAIAWRRVRWSYGELLKASECVRDALLARGTEQGARIAILVRNSPHYAALYYGVLAAGCAAVPLNAQERAPVLARQVQHCGARWLFVERDHPERKALTAALAGSDVQTIEITLDDGPDCVATFMKELPSGSPARAPAELQRDDLATIIYTSGTTGRPKGVMLSHGNVAANSAGIISYLRLSRADRGLCVLPFHFSYGASVLNTHLLSGAMLLIEDNFAFPKVTLERMQNERVTGFPGVPSTFAILLGRCDLSEVDLSAMRYMTQAGGPMPRPLIERLRQQAPHVQFFVMYGQTEATARLAYLPPEELDTRPGSVGVPLPGVEIKVFEESGVEAAPGRVGEICARGPNVMLGYWNNPAATAEVLKDGWLHTGDLGHKDADGYLYIDGRAADMIKVGAFRVSPQEVEEVIAALPGVEEVGVTAIADEVLGSAIKAVIVRRADATLDMRTVKAHCRQQLASYKIPKVVEFASSLPRTSSGKIQRFKLA